MSLRCEFMLGVVDIMGFLELQGGICAAYIRRGRDSWMANHACICLVTPIMCGGSDEAVPLVVYPLHTCTLATWNIIGIYLHTITLPQTDRKRVSAEEFIYSVH